MRIRIGFRRERGGNVMKIYVASSWKNLFYPGIIAAIRSMGHEVYDFRHPIPGNNGFSWHGVDPEYDGGKVSAEHWRRLLAHPLAERGYEFDMRAVQACDVCILVLPAGRSASFEFGVAMRQGSKCIVLALDDETPDLMFRSATICGTMNEFFDAMNFHPAT
jgi:hypothetical protein